MYDNYDSRAAGNVPGHPLQATYPSEMATEQGPGLVPFAYLGAVGPSAHGYGVARPGWTLVVDSAAQSCRQVRPKHSRSRARISPVLRRFNLPGCAAPLPYVG